MSWLVKGLYIFANKAEVSVADHFEKWGLNINEHAMDIVLMSFL